MSNLPARLELSSAQLEQIDACLNEMLVESQARCTLLADISGQLISEKGDFAHMNTAVLSALAAGELAATKELARLVGEPARFKLLLHEGERQCVYYSDVGEEMVLITIFDTSTAIGLVRLHLRKLVGELVEIAKTPQLSPPENELLLDDDLDNLLTSQLDTFFQKRTLPEERDVH